MHAISRSLFLCAAINKDNTIVCRSIYRCLYMSIIKHEGKLPKLQVQPKLQYDRIKVTPLLKVRRWQAMVKIRVEWLNNIDDAVEKRDVPAAVRVQQWRFDLKVRVKLRYLLKGGWLRWQVNQSGGSLVGHDLPLQSGVTTESPSFVKTKLKNQAFETMIIIRCAAFN